VLGKGTFYRQTCWAPVGKYENWTGNVRVLEQESGRGIMQMYRSFFTSLYLTRQVDSRNQRPVNLLANILRNVLDRQNRKPLLLTVEYRAR